MIDKATQHLWMEVLHAVIDDALHGVRGTDPDRRRRIHVIKDARTYLTKPNKDCDIVCAFAGIDPDALRSRMQRKIKDAPTPEELVATKRPTRRGQTFAMNGETKTIAEWAVHTGLEQSLISKRLTDGWPIERVLSPVHVKGRPPQTAGRASLGLC